MLTGMAGHPGTLRFDLDPQGTSQRDPKGGYRTLIQLLFDMDVRSKSMCVGPLPIAT